MNVLSILLDDIGLEQFNRWGRGSNYPATPTIDAWVDGGIKFTKFYVQQLCSPTRATILTGVHPFRHGIGDLVRGPIQLVSIETRKGLQYPTVASWCKKAGIGIRTAAIGKWHLSTEFEGGLYGPSFSGFDYCSVNMFNLPGSTVDGSPAVQTYHTWSKNVNGKLVQEDEYLPKVNVRELIEWINQRGKEPWVVHLAPYSCHTPFVVNGATVPYDPATEITGAPPDGTYDDVTWDITTAATQTVDGQTLKLADRNIFKACIEAIDYYLGTIASSVAPEVWNDTLVILMTDNGSGVQNAALEVDPLTGTNYPLTASRAKDTPYDGATHCPLLMYSAGDLITNPGREVTDVVSAVDICPTILELMGVSTPNTTLHGKSLVPYIDDTASSPVNDYIYSEHFLQNHGVDRNNGFLSPEKPVDDDEREENQWVVCDGKYQLIYNRPLANPIVKTNPDTYFEFYDLDADPHQLTNLTPGGSTSGLSGSEAAARTAMLEWRTALIAAG